VALINLNCITFYGNMKTWLSKQMYVQQYWNNVLSTGHNEKGLKPAIFHLNSLISQGDFFFHHTISPVMTSYSSQHYCNLKQLLWKCIWGAKLMKLENYILDTNKKNCDMLLFYPFISFTCGNTGPLKKKAPIWGKLCFFSSANYSNWVETHFIKWIAYLYNDHLL